MNCQKTVLDARSRREKEIQPITAELREKSDLTDCGRMASETALSKQEQQTIRTIIASICEPSNSSLMESQSDNEMCDNSTIQFADKPPLRTPMCYSINQVVVLRKGCNSTCSVWNHVTSKQQ